MKSSTAGAVAMPSQWGYPAAAGGILAYAVFLLSVGRLGIHHLSLAVLFLAALLPYGGGRRFVREWWPMILFWLNYDSMRVYAPWLISRAAVEQPYLWEFSLFLAPSGAIWPFYFTDWRARHADTMLGSVLDGWFNAIYLSHLFTIPVLFFAVWLLRRKRLFRRLLWSFTILHVLAFAVYLAYPAAPPWWIYENGFTLPSSARSAPVTLGKESVLAGLFLLSPNKFAAIPSVHTAYPLLLTLVLALHGVTSRWIWVSGIYAANMWFACVFLNQHYVVDLVLGAALVPVALLGARGNLIPGTRA